MKIEGRDTAFGGEMNMEKRPVIAIPMGDPAGIGPEIVLRAMMR